MKPLRSFASDNNASVHPEVLQALADANRGHVIGYGDDPYTARSVAKFREHFGDVEVFFVFNGTGANVLSLQALTRSFHAVLSTETAHIHTDECGAPEKFTGCKIVVVPTALGKLTVENVAHHYHGIGDPHHVQPRVVSITQATELGTVYQPDEIRALAEFCHAHDMFLHVDGARIANAAVSLGLDLCQITGDLGVDALSFGGTKNGLMGAEAVVFFRRELAQNFLYWRKQSMQLASKMRFLAVQFETLLTGDLWRRGAQQANRMARLLAEKLRTIAQVTIVYPVEANGVFAKIPKAAIPIIQERYFFYVWDAEQGVVRWMCSFDTTEQDVEDFVACVASVVQSPATALR
jgi:threonine aldolase